MFLRRNENWFTRTGVPLAENFWRYLTTVLGISMTNDVPSWYLCSYEWSCSIMTGTVGDAPLSCFTDNTTVLPAARVVRLSVQSLRARPDSAVTDYRFELTVSRPGRGSATRDQVVQVKPTASLKYVTSQRPKNSLLCSFVPSSDS